MATTPLRRTVATDTPPPRWISAENAPDHGRIPGRTEGARHDRRTRHRDPPLAGMTMPNPDDARHEAALMVAYDNGSSSGYADWVTAFNATNIEFPDRVNMWSPTEVAQWVEAEMMRNR